MNKFMTAIWVVGAAVTTSHAIADEKAATSGEAELSFMDENGDGELSAGEHAAGARKMFMTMDADHDGVVTASEMDVASEAMAGNGPKGKGKSSVEKIKDVDTNKDGSLSTDEHAAGAQQMFRKMDTNQDGVLTAAEIDAGHRNMLQASD